MGAGQGALVAWLSLVSLSRALLIQLLLGVVEGEIAISLPQFAAPAGGHTEVQIHQRKVMQ
jgi:hypothetical protein